MKNKIVLSKLFLLIFVLMGITYCQIGLHSDYIGGITQATLIGATWQQINTDFDGTYRRWQFLNEERVVQNLRGAILYYDWEPYEISGTVAPNPDNQAVFKISSGSPGGTLYQYMLVWFINAEGTTAIFQIYVTPEDIIRYLVNEQHAVSKPSYKKILVKPDN